jgi:hypothetical protein
MLAVGFTLAVWALAVLPHRGEFWPFSIYPMFARAGRPWTNALVVEVDPHARRDWGPWTLQNLPGRVYPTQPVGVSAADVSQLVKLTASWTDEKIGLTRRLFHAALAEGRTLMIVRSDGRLTRDLEVAVDLAGVLLIGPDGHELNPGLRAAP